MNYYLQIEQDTDYPDPRKDFEHCGQMFCCHPGYDLGDKQFDSSEALQETVDDLPEGTAVLPLFLYDHSGLSIRTRDFADPWDSGQIGYIVMLPEAIKKELIEDPEEVLRLEVEEYNQYLTGDVWFYCVRDQFGDDIESCGWFYGYEACERHAMDALDYIKKDSLKNHLKQVKTHIKNRVPLEKRENF